MELAPNNAGQVKVKSTILEITGIKSEPFKVAFDMKLYRGDVRGHTDYPVSSVNMDLTGMLGVQAGKYADYNVYRVMHKPATTKYPRDYVLEWNTKDRDNFQAAYDKAYLNHSIKWVLHGGRDTNLLIN
ncbi:hypothetical protein [Paenibacillus assamensis]|uniref:hypothetical protein n=1 Tax=Paenibacillus assamensis TaxID=311244 RepID=UPI00048F31A2|nr:hypothetical protein [Paenibacillus assamensis]